MTLRPLCPDPERVQQAASVTFREVWLVSSVKMSCNSQFSSLLTFCKTPRCMLSTNKHQQRSHAQQSACMQQENQATMHLQATAET